MTRTPRLALAALVLLLAACHKQYRVLPPAALTSSVPRLTSALRAEVIHYPNEQLVAATFRLKPELEQDFRGYSIRTHSSGTNLVVLVCTRDGKYALYEDASWTPYVDKAYEPESRHPAAFSIDPATGPPPGR
jgi:hypothetical protein